MVSDKPAAARLACGSADHWRQPLLGRPFAHRKAAIP